MRHYTDNHLKFPRLIAALLAMSYYRHQAQIIVSAKCSDRCRG